MLTVYFALVAEEATRIDEAAEVVAFRYFADVGTRVLVHVFPVTFVSHLALDSNGGNPESTYVHSDSLENEGGF